MALIQEIAKELLDVSKPANKKYPKTMASEDKTRAGQLLRMVPSKKNLRPPVRNINVPKGFVVKPDEAPDYEPVSGYVAARPSASKAAKKASKKAAKKAPKKASKKASKRAAAPAAFVAAAAPKQRRASKKSSAGKRATSSNLNRLKAQVKAFRQAESAKRKAGAITVPFATIRQMEEALEKCVKEEKIRRQAGVISVPFAEIKKLEDAVAMYKKELAKYAPDKTPLTDAEKAYEKAFRDQTAMGQARDGVGIGGDVAVSYRRGKKKVKGASGAAATGRTFSRDQASMYAESIFEPIRGVGGERIVTVGPMGQGMASAT